MRVSVPILFAAACGSSSASTDGEAAKAHAWKPQHERALAIVRRTTEQLSHDPTGPRPDWVLYDPKGEQVVFVGSDAGTERALAIAKSYDVELPVPHYDPLASYTPPPPLPPPPPYPGIHAVDDTHFMLDRALIDKILADPMTASQGARVVPSIKNGQPNGFKLYAIRPNSIYAALGFANGDTITSINGHDLSSPDKALEVYTELKDATSFDVSIMRRGRDSALHYEIK